MNGNSTWMLHEGWAMATRLWFDLSGDIIIIALTWSGY